VYNQTGILVGSAVIESDFTAITLWGDDELTPETDGLLPGEDFIIKIYDGDNVKTLDGIWLEGDNQYSANKISILKFVENPNNIGDETVNLSQNIPNPFNHETEFSFYLPEQANIKFSIINIVGEVVDVLISGVMEKGDHILKFQADALPTGVYYYTLEAGNYISTKKMVIIK